MCQMCEYKRDMKILQSCFDLLATVDFENFFVMSDLVLSMIYTIDINKSFDIDMAALLEVPEDTDHITVTALRGFQSVAMKLQDAHEELQLATEDTIGELRAAMEGIGTAEEDDLNIPPSAFSDFFEGGNHDE